MDKSTLTRKYPHRASSKWRSRSADHNLRTFDHKLPVPLRGSGAPVSALNASPQQPPFEPRNRLSKKRAERAWANGPRALGASSEDLPNMVVLEAAGQMVEEASPDASVNHSLLALLAEKSDAVVGK